ncbi:MAG: S-adenosylmethionine-binding protein, partial [Nitrospirae bacterium]|nr:S-adenosylmethionine-binding protein [Nitrospirota bacterium]
VTGEGLYSVVYANPPWQYDQNATDEGMVSDSKYPTMSTEYLCALQIDRITKPDAILFLWVPAPLIPDGLQVLNAWGFKYVTHAVWDKEVIGMGNTFKMQHEDLLVGRKGAYLTPQAEHRPASVIREKWGEYNGKPEVFMEYIERMYPTAVKVELFAMQHRAGWAVWNNQADTCKIGNIVNTGSANEVDTGSHNAA